MTWLVLKLEGLKVLKNILHFSQLIYHFGFNQKELNHFTLKARSCNFANQQLATQQQLQWQQ